MPLDNFDEGVTATLLGRRPLSTFAFLFLIAATTVSLGGSKANRLNQESLTTSSYLSFQGSTISLHFLCYNSHEKVDSIQIYKSGGPMFLLHLPIECADEPGNVHTRQAQYVYGGISAAGSFSRLLLQANGSIF